MTSVACGCVAGDPNACRPWTGADEHDPLCEVVTSGLTCEGPNGYDCHSMCSCDLIERVREDQRRIVATEIFHAALGRHDLLNGFIQNKERTGWIMSFTVAAGGGPAASALLREIQADLDEDEHFILNERA